MIRFALIAASTLGFFLTAALGNLMVPLLRAFQGRWDEPKARQTPSPKQEAPDAEPERPPQAPTMGGLCLMVGTLAAVGVGWTAACVAQPELLGTESLLTTRLLIALFGALCFGVVGLADDVVRLRHRSPLGLRRPVRLALEAASGTLVLALLGLNHCLPDGLALPGIGYCTLGPLAPVVWLAILVALAESARTADGMDGTDTEGYKFMTAATVLTVTADLSLSPRTVYWADDQKTVIDLAEKGKTVLMVSSEMPELLGVCDRILVMSGGQLAGEVDAATATQEEIMALAAKYA